MNDNMETGVCVCVCVVWCACGFGVSLEKDDKGFEKFSESFMFEALGTKVP